MNVCLYIPTFLKIIKKHAPGLHLRPHASLGTAKANSEGSTNVAVAFRIFSMGGGQLAPPLTK